MSATAAVAQAIKRDVYVPGQFQEKLDEELPAVEAFEAAMADWKC